MYLVYRSDPEYFNVVSQPIDLTRIQQKVKTEEYRSVDELYADIHLLVSNNKKYYKVFIPSVSFSFVSMINISAFVHIISCMKNTRVLCLAVLSWF